jgi:hypothetical protein
MIFTTCHNRTYTCMKKKIVFSLIGISLILLTGIALRTPSNDRTWSPDQKILTNGSIDGTTIYLEHIRNARYTSPTDYSLSYYNKRFDISSIQSVDFIVEPFEGIGAAHTFLTFGLTDGSYLAVSIEIRKEEGESFSPLLGAIRQYELAYVIAHEKDVIDLRANHRKDIVYLYPTNATQDEAQKLFLDILTRAKKLEEHPEFYNTITNNCTTNIVRHINTLRNIPISWDHRMLFPKNADTLAQELGFIAQGMTIEAARSMYRINERAEKFAEDPDFSKKIRAVDTPELSF